jgi:predicted glycoside hydrolase/deacetylase ChbG (UPF0249 family)
MADHPAGPKPQDSLRGAKPVVLCADDFGITPGVSRGILDLLSLGRLSATSVMTNAPGWTDAAAGLRAFDSRAGIGLHLTFTYGAPLGRAPTLAPSGAFLGLGAILKRSLSGRMPAAEVEAEIERQLMAFVEAFGRWPDFVDGHQHVHVLPGVRRPLLATLRRLGLAGRLWLRDPTDRWSAIAKRRQERAKAMLVGALASGFGAAARSAGFALNEGFSGFSAFDPAGDLEAAFHSFFQALGPRPVVMCHPGHVEDASGLDTVIEARGREQAYLASPAFTRLLEERNITLTPAP